MPTLAQSWEVNLCMSSLYIYIYIYIYYIYVCVRTLAKS